MLQRVLGFGWQTLQRRDHEIYHIVGVASCVNAVEIPRPARSGMIEEKHPLFGESSDKLKGEERIAARFFVQQLRQRLSAFRLAAKRICNQLRKVFACERRKLHLFDLSAGVLDGFKLARQRMRDIDLIAPISADQ